VRSALHDEHERSVDVWMCTGRYSSYNLGRTEEFSSLANRVRIALHDENERSVDVWMCTGRYSSYNLERTEELSLI
jgi:hypothetical protein